MITKAGVPSKKIFVGIASYGRSFKMADPNCKGPTCKFLGTREYSPATPGVCTQTGGYISNAEIRQQMAIYSAGGGVSYESYYDEASDSDIAIFGGTDWVAYMDTDLKQKRVDLYKSLNFGGTTDWAIDLEADFSLKDGELGSDYPGVDDLQLCNYDQVYATLDDVEKASGNLDPECAAYHAIKVMQNDLQHSFDGYDDAASGYDDKFGTYEQYIRDTLDGRLVDFMAENHDGTKFFRCFYAKGRSSKRSDASEVNCNNRPWESWADANYWFELQDEKGYNQSLLDMGVDPEWVKFGVSTKSRTSTPPCGSFCYDDKLTCYGFPVRADVVEIPDPKEIVQKARDNFGTLSDEYTARMLELKMDLWDGGLSDLIEVLAMPITMIKDAIANMQEVKKIGKEVQDEQKKNLILKILEGVLFIIPFLGGAVGRLGVLGARIGRLLSTVEGFGDLAYTTYVLIQDPTMAPIAALTMLCGPLAGNALKYSQVAKAKRAMNTKQLDAMGPTFKTVNPKVQNIVKNTCKNK